MTTLLGFAGIICSIVMIIYRERVADMIGEGDWMGYVGGVYNFVVLLAVLLFFFSVASLTGSLDLFLAPIRWLLPSPETTTLDMP